MRQPGKHCSYWERLAEELKARVSPVHGFSQQLPAVCPTPRTKQSRLGGGPASQFLRAHTLTLFLWQGSHLLHEDQAESTQSRGWGRLLTDRACLLLATLLLVLLALRDSSSPLHSINKSFRVWNHRAVRTEESGRPLCHTTCLRELMLVGPHQVFHAASRFPYSLILSEHVPLLSAQEQTQSSTPAPRE